MLNSKSFANAVTVVSLAVYVVCRVLAQVTPGFLLRVSRSWFHTFDPGNAQAQMDLGTFIFGAVVLGLLSWVTTFATIELYNKFAKK